jgi:CheY-like chemotaxis protein
MITETGTAIKKVLVVDDSQELRRLFSRMFNRNQFQVRLAVDGKDAVSALEFEMPDLVILDVNMPHLSGLEVMRYIRQKRGGDQVKVIMITGDVYAQFEPEAKLADLFLMKPVSIRQLLTYVEDITGIKSAAIL